MSEAPRPSPFSASADLRLLRGLVQVQALEMGRTGRSPSAAELYPSVAAALALRDPSASDGRPDLLTLRHGAPTASVLRGLPPTALQQTAPGRTNDFGHPTDLEHGLVAPVPHPGTSLEVLAGAALSFRLRGEPRVALLIDDLSATDSGDWHEGFNLAAVRSVPLVVVIVTSDRGRGRMRASMVQKAVAYGVHAERLSVDDPAALYTALTRTVDELRREPQTRLVDLTGDSARVDGPGSPDAPSGDPVGRFSEPLIRAGAITRNDFEQEVAAARRRAADLFAGAAA